jgi:hypothetical protein
MYTPEGLLKVSALNPKNKRLFPWDSVDNVKFRDGTRGRRCKIKITAEMVPFTSYFGLGLIRRNDIGRTLVVDFHDAWTIDLFE